jgi:hypothetical protein
MRRQAGFFDVDDRLKRLSDLGDQLEAFEAAVEFEAFRPNAALTPTTPNQKSVRTSSMSSPIRRIGWVRSVQLIEILELLFGPRIKNLRVTQPWLLLRPYRMQPTGFASSRKFHIAACVLLGVPARKRAVRAIVNRTRKTISVSTDRDAECIAYTVRTLFPT